MNNYKLIYLAWLLPAFFLGLIFHQTMVYYSIIDTYENGNSYTAEILDFEFKQIASQTNGYVVLQFTTKEGEEIQKQLSLPIEMAGELQQANVMPVRYQPNTFQEVVILPTYNMQKGLVWTNIGMAFIGLLITLFIAFIAHRYANKLKRDGTDEMVIERVDK